MDKWQACPVTVRAGSEGAKPQPELVTKGLEEAHVTNVTENTPTASTAMRPLLCASLPCLYVLALCFWLVMCKCLWRE